MEEKRNTFWKKAAKAVIAVVVVLVVGCLVIKHSISVPKEEEELYISILNTEFQYRGEDDMGFDMYGKNYLLPEGEAMIEEVEALVEGVPCYRTPKTIYKNIQSRNGMLVGFSGEDSYEKSIKFSWLGGTEDKENDFLVIYENGYVSIGECYYSLGMGKKEKAKEIMEEVEAYLDKNAGQYCEEWEDIE